MARSCDYIPQIKTKDGLKSSLLFQRLLNEGYSREDAKAIYRGIHSPQFRKDFGDWIKDPKSVQEKLDENGEPFYEFIMPDEVLIPYHETEPKGVREVYTDDIHPLLARFITEGETGFTTVLKRIIEHSNNRHHVSLARHLLNRTDFFRGNLPKINFINERTLEGSIAHYTLVDNLYESLNIASGTNNVRSNEISIAVGAFDEDARKFQGTERFERVLLHEIVHAFTSTALLTGNKNEQQTQFAKDIRLLYIEARRRLRDSGMNAYGLTNEREFVAELMTNPEFVRDLRSLKEENFWQRVLNAFKDLLGIGTRNTLYSRALEKVLSFVDEGHHTAFTTPGSKDAVIERFSDLSQTEKIERRAKIVEDAIRDIYRKINEYSNRPTFRSATFVKREKEEAKKLQQLLEDRKYEEAILRSAERANKALKQANSRLADELDNGTLTLSSLNEIYKYAKGFSIIEDIESELRLDKELRESLGDGVLQEVANGTEIVKQINKHYLEYSRRLLVDKFLPFEKQTEVDFRERFEREFRESLKEKGDKWKSTPQQIEDQLRYVEDQMAIHEADIMEEKRDRITSMFLFTQNDISVAEHWAVAMQHVGDQMLNMVQDMINQAQYNIRQDYIAFEEELHKKLEALREAKRNPGDPRKLYEDILERDEEGNLTQHFVSEFRSGWEQALWDILNEVEDLSESQRKVKLAKWFKENTRQNPEWAKLRAGMLKEKKKIAEKKGEEAAKEYEVFWLDQNKHKKSVPSDKWKNPQYDKLMSPKTDSRVKDFYNFVMESQDGFDSGRPEFKKLGYKLPGVRKTKMERFASGEISFQSMKEALSEEWRREADETEFGETEYVAEDIEGNIRRYVPIFFTGDIDPKNQSYDVATLLAMNGYTSMNYKRMTKLLPEVDAIRAIIGEREVGQKSGRGLFMFSKDTKKPFTSKGTESNIYKLVNAFFDDKIYGQHSVDQKFLNLSPEVWNQIMKYTATTMLAGNVVAGITNVSLGSVITVIEAIGGHNIDRKGWIKAKEHYFKDLANLSIIGDIGRDTYKSKTNLLSEEFDALNNFRGNRFNYVNNNWAKRQMQFSSLYALNTMGEHFVQHVVMYGVLNKTKVKDNEGRYLDKDFNPTSDPGKGISLLDAYSLDEGGKLTVNDKVSKVIVDGRERDWNDDTRYFLSRKIWHINELLHGAYSQQNRSEAQRYIVGKLAWMLKKWIEPGLRRRFRGVSNLKGQVFGKEYRDTRIFSQQLGEYEEGNYITAVKFIRDILRDTKDLQRNVAAYWSDMTAAEKANVKKTLAEVATFIILAQLAVIARSMAENAGEDDEDKYWMMAYQANRLKTELTFFINPREATRIVRDPSPVISFSREIIELGYQLTDPMERYERGDRKGQLKIRKNFERIFPLYRHWDRLEHMEDALAYFGFYRT